MNGIEVKIYWVDGKREELWAKELKKVEDVLLIVQTDDKDRHIHLQDTMLITTTYIHNTEERKNTHKNQTDYLASFKTNEDCRQLFAESGLTYKHITEISISTLILLLNKHMQKASISCETNAFNLHISDKIKSDYDSDGTLIQCGLYMDSDSFTQRECIIFYKDGSISFGGWADSRDKPPIRAAFAEWVGIMSQQVCNCQISSKGF